MYVHIPQVIGQGYEAFWNCRKRYRIVKGGRASKKSRTTALWYIYHLMKYFHVYNVKPCLLVVRRYANTNKNSTYSELKWAIARLKVAHLWHAPKSELTLTYRPSGQVILFRGMDEPESLTSISVPVGNLCWCWAEEFFQLHNEEDWNKLDMSFRGEVPAPLFKQITGIMNPWTALTWIKPRFFDNPDSNTFTDTTTYLQNEFLDDSDREIFEHMRINNPRRYSVEGLGEFGVTEGLVYAGYAEYPEKNHVELMGEKILFITCGLDYGSGAPTDGSKLGKTCLIACAVTENFNKVFAIAESYFNDFFLPERITKWVIDFLVNLREKHKVDVLLHAEWASSESQNNSIRLELLNSGIEGISIENAYKSTILDRIDLTQILLGERRLLFTYSVPNLKKAFSNAMWDSKKSKLKGVPVRLDDGSNPHYDLLDSIEYSLIKYAKYLLAGKKYFS
jgi:PBSX family phage terminase large subunit